MNIILCYHFLLCTENSLQWHFNGRFKHCSHQGLCGHFFIYPISLYLSKHSWGRREDLEELSYTHTHTEETPGVHPGSHCQTWPIPFCRSKIHILPEMAPEGQHLVTQHNCSKQRESPSDSRISKAAGMLHVAADIQS